MPSNSSFKIPTKKKNLFLRVSKGHFATTHSHTNYYIDVTTQKARLSDAMAIAEELLTYYRSNTIVDTILCLDGTEVIGTCLATLLTRDDFANLNAHQTIYVVTPEHTTTGSQLIFRDNTSAMIKHKHVLILAASLTTGYTAESAIEAVKYYDGSVVGVSSVFSTVEKCCGVPVVSAFDHTHLPDYESYNSHECPMCKSGQPVDALVNSYGYSKL